MRTIDPSIWLRREIYELFSGCDHPFYSVSLELDVTNLHRYTHENGLSFYYSLSYLVTEAMESVEAMRIRIRDGRLVVTDALIPSCTDILPGSDCFVIVTLPRGDDMAAFCQKARALALTQKSLFDPGMEVRDDLIYFSCLPWFTLTGFVTERNLDVDDCIPRVTWGKYQRRGDSLILNLTVEVNHRTVDGIHLGRFYEALQARINSL